MANLINGFYQVNVGTNPNDGTGDSFRDCFIATNINWGKVSNAGLGNTTLGFANSTISAPAGNSINFAVSSAYVNLGNAGTSLVGDSGNVRLGGGLTGQFLRTSDATGNVYWSGGAAGSDGMVQYNQSGAFGAQSSFAYDASNGRLSVENLLVSNSAAIQGNLNLNLNDITVRDLFGRNFQFTGDGVMIGNFTVIGNVTAANATTVDIGNNLITIANTATSIVLLEQSGIAWGNAALLGTGNTPNIRFRDIGGSNIQQTVMAIYPGIWTTGLYVSATAAPTTANLAPGRITFAADTQFSYQNSTQAATFSNLQADVFTSAASNVTRSLANTLDITTNASDGSTTAGRLLRIRNTSSPSGNVGLQIVNQSGGGNAAWDIFSRPGNGALTLAWSANANSTSSERRLEISDTGNLQIPYSSVTNGFIGFGPGNAAHAGMRYVGSEYTLHLEANGAIDRLQLGTSGSSRVTILGASVPALSGFVGILNENPISPLTVTGNTDGNRIQSGLTVSRAGMYTGSYTLGVDNSSNQFFIADSTSGGQGITRVSIDGTGNVGVNLGTPAAALDVAGGGRFRTGGAGPSVSAGNNQALTLYANSSLDTVNLQFADTGNANVWAMGYQQATTGDFWIYQNESGADIRHITLKRNAASVGINQPNPRANLHVSSNAAGVMANLAVQSPGGAELGLTAYPEYGAVGTTNNFPLAFQVNSVNVMTVTAAGLISTTGNVSAGYFIGDGSLLTGIVAGTNYSNANVANYLQVLNSNVTTSANISGAYILGNGAFLSGLAATYSNANVASYLASNAAVTITTSDTVTAAAFYTTGTSTTGTQNVNGNLNVAGNVNITGNLNYANVNNLVINDPLIYLGANNTSNVYDLGTVVTYNDGVSQYGGWVRDATDGTWKLFGNVTTTPGTTVDFTNAIYQPMQAGAITATAGTFSQNLTAAGNISGAYILGNGAFLSGLPAGYSNTNVASYLASNSAITITTTGNVTGAYILGNGAFLTGLNYTNYSNTNAAAYLSSNSSTAVTTTGNVTGGNIISRGLISGSFAPRTQSGTTIASPLAVNSDTYDIYAASAQAGNLTINADSATPVDGRKLIFRITSDGTGRTITFTGGVARGYKPVGTVLTSSGSNWTYTLTASKTTYFGAMYNSASSRWEILALSQET